jgi:uncharacterized membrane protein
MFTTEMISFKEIVRERDLKCKLDSPVSRSLFLYLEERQPRNIFMSDFNEKVFTEKSAACRILLMLAVQELQSVGYLKQAVHKHDRIELVYS